MNTQNLFIGNIWEMREIRKLLKEDDEGVFLLVKLKFAKQLDAMSDALKALEQERNIIILFQNN